LTYANLHDTLSSAQHGATHQQTPTANRRPNHDKRYSRKTESGWSSPTVITPYDDFASTPDWSRSNGLIVFSINDYSDFQDSDKPSNLFTIKPDGTALTPVTHLGPGEARASQASWTPDGRIIFTYVTGAQDREQNPAFINMDGSGMKVLTGLHDCVHSRMRPTL
jgi:hypothetical protein